MTEPVDRHVRHSGADYAEGLSALLPTGPAWNRDEEGVLWRLIYGLAQIWGDPVDRRAAELLERETDPRVTVAMLSDWERAFGLPDPCLSEVLSVADRQVALVQKMTTAGGQSRAFFLEIAAALGHTITIHEHSPYMCGVSRCGPTVSATPTDVSYLLTESGGYLLTDSGGRIIVSESYAVLEPRCTLGPAEMRFWWEVKATETRLTWFRAGSGQVGVDPMLRISVMSDLECIFRRWKPAHTNIRFHYAIPGALFDGAVWDRSAFS